VYVEGGAAALTESTEAEEDRVEEAPGLQRNSRLACQLMLTPSSDGLRIRLAERQF
jgi:ferredoxin